MRERIGIILCVVGALGALLAFFGPASLWQYLDPGPGGARQMLTLIYSLAIILIGLFAAMSRQAWRLG